MLRLSNLNELKFNELLLVLTEISFVLLALILKIYMFRIDVVDGIPN